MRAQACSPQDIKDLNNHKEYTLISTQLLESVLTDPNLNAQASKLWQILFNKAKYNDNLAVKISYQYLADKLKKSTRTISRYVKTLINAGYLLIKHNYDRNGGQRPSTLSICAPETFVQNIRKNKDRTTKNNLINNKTLLENNIFCLDEAKPACPNALTATQSDITPDKNSNNDKNVLCETLEKTCIGNPEIEEDKSTEHTSPLSYLANDKIDRGGDDTHVLLNKNNIKEINTIKTTVVVPFSNEKTLERFHAEKKIIELREQLRKNSEMLTTITDHQLYYDQVRKNKAIEGELNIQRFIIERLTKQHKTETLKQEIHQTLSDNARYIADKPGERNISSFTFKRLMRSLKNYGYDNSALNNLMNEIVYEVRFGSLMKSNKSKTSLNIDNAINIALKLVRENRWSTPKILENFIE